MKRAKFDRLAWMRHRPGAVTDSTSLNRSSERGFLLVEMLVGLALIGMAAALLQVGVGAARRDWAGAGARGSESVAAAQMILRERIERLIPVTSHDGSAPFADLRGTATELRFYGAPAMGEGAGDLRRYRLMLGEGDDLMLYALSGRSARIDLNALSTEGWRARPIIDGVRMAELAYFGAAPPDFRRRWRDHWQDRPAPPELIRLRVGFVEGDRRLWPDLIMRPAANAGSACVIDMLTGRCRGDG